MIYSNVTPKRKCIALDNFLSLKYNELRIYLKRIKDPKESRGREKIGNKI